MMNTQPTIDALDNLLANLTGKDLHIDFNEHKTSYHDLASELEFHDGPDSLYKDALWVELPYREEAIRKNELWSLVYERDEKYTRYLAASPAGILEPFTKDPEIAAAMEKLYALFNTLLTGEYSCASLFFNDQLVNYKSIQEALDKKDSIVDPGRWVSQEEFDKGVKLNRMWTLQWYPRTPIGFNTRHAASLAALVSYFENKE